jgi:hypothetical protein
MAVFIPNGPGCPPPVTIRALLWRRRPGRDGALVPLSSYRSQEATGGYVSHEVILVWACLLRSVVLRASTCYL